MVFTILGDWKGRVRLLRHSHGSDRHRRWKAHHPAAALLCMDDLRSKTCRWKPCSEDEESTGTFPGVTFPGWANIPLPRRHTHYLLMMAIHSHVPWVGPLLEEP